MRSTEIPVKGLTPRALSNWLLEVPPDAAIHVRVEATSWYKDDPNMEATAIVATWEH